MSRASIRKALESHLNTLSPAWPTAWENVTFVHPTDGTPWQRAHVMFSETRALGAPAGAPEEWTGLLHVGLWVPAGKGIGPAEQRAELLRGNRGTGVVGHFQRGQVLTADGVSITILQPYDGPVLDSEPKWYGLPVLIPFVHHAI